MTVRTATPADVPALVDLAARTFPLACPPDMPTEDMAAFVATHLSAERFTAHLADPSAEVLVVDDAAAVAGYSLTFAQLERERPTVELSKCYADPAVHGSGAASRLVTVVLDHARELGARSVWLGVNGRNVRAQRFYAKHGFEVVGERRFVVGARTEDDLVLEHQFDR